MTEQSVLSRQIPDDWLNDSSTYRRCFVCGQDNPAGLHAHYRQEGDRVVTEFVGEERHQGFPGVVHGGLIASLLDETMGRTALFARAWTMTGRMEVRYRYPAPLGEKLTVSAWIKRERRQAFEARGEVRLPSGDLVAESKGLFLRVPEEVRRQAEEAHPEFAPYFAALPHESDPEPNA